MALIGAYELLMREFRGSASRTRETPEGEPSHEQAENSEGTTAVAAGQSSGPLHVLSERAEVSSQGREAKLDEVLPRVQVEAWYWTLNNRGEDGALLTGKEIGRAFGRKERWGRLVKRHGEQGVLGVGPDIHDADGSEMSSCAGALIGAGRVGLPHPAKRVRFSEHTSLLGGALGHVLAHGGVSGDFNHFPTGSKPAGPERGPVAGRAVARDGFFPLVPLDNHRRLFHDVTEPSTTAVRAVCCCRVC